MKKRFTPAQRPAGSPALARAEDAGHAEEREGARGGFSDVDCAVARTLYPILWHKPMRVMDFRSGCDNLPTDPPPLPSRSLDSQRR